MFGHHYLRNVVSLELDELKCNGCRTCIEVCPHGVYVFRDQRAHIADRDACMECGACAVNCSEEAITVDAGVGCAAAIIGGALRGTEPTCDCSGPADSC